MRPLLIALAVLLGLGSTGHAQDDPQATSGVIPAGQSAPAPAPAASDSVGGPEQSDCGQCQRGKEQGIEENLSLFARFGR